MKICQKHNSCLTRLTARQKAKRCECCCC